MRVAVQGAIRVREGPRAGPADVGERCRGRFWRHVGCPWPAPETPRATRREARPGAAPDRRGLTRSTRGDRPLLRPPPPASASAARSPAPGASVHAESQGHGRSRMRSSKRASRPVGASSTVNGMDQLSNSDCRWAVPPLTMRPSASRRPRRGSPGLGLERGSRRPVARTTEASLWSTHRIAKGWSLASRGSSAGTSFRGAGRPRGSRPDRGRREAATRPARGARPTGPGWWRHLNPSWLLRRPGAPAAIREPRRESLDQDSQAGYDEG